MIEYSKRIQRNRRPGTQWRRGGFSFTEILFAVMILGIGFIMVAAVFPVALKQTQETVEETTAADVAKGAASYLARIGTNLNFPTTWPQKPDGTPAIIYNTSPTPTPDYNGNVVQFSGYTGSNTGTAFWNAVAGNLILSTDTRFAWIPFYSRGANANGVALPYAQVTIICVEARNTSSYASSDLNMVGTPALANLEGRPALATFADGGANPDTITFTADSGGPASPNAEIAEGSYVVVADDTTITPPANAVPVSCNGYVYRVGVQILPATNPPQWELLPGSDMKNSRYKPIGAAVHVFVVGRGYNNPANGDSSIAGPAMDVACYSTFIPVRNSVSPSAH